MADQDPALEGQDNPEAPDLDWVPENFRRDTVEDTLKAVLESQTNAQRKITELSTEKRGLEESINALSSQFEEFTAAQSQPDPSVVHSQLLEAYENDPIGLMAQIAQSTAQNYYEQQSKAQQQQPAIKPEDFATYVANQTLTAKYEDFSELSPKIIEVIQNDPLYQQDHLWVSPDLATHALDRAYQTVKAQELLSGNALAERQAADTRNMKLAAQSASGAAGRTPSPDDYQKRWDEIVNANSGKLGL